MSATTKKPICKKCKGDDVRVDAFAEWDCERQDWILSSVYEYSHCETCEGETTVEWIEITESPYKGFANYETWLVYIHYSDTIKSLDDAEQFERDFMASSADKLHSEFKDVDRSRVNWQYFHESLAQDF